jgi:hypothetical protein
MKMKLICKWGQFYDWILIPTIMVGMREGLEITIDANKGIGIALLFLKFKVEIHIYIQ